ncbi:MAG: ABC transporter ATP-binding protein [Lentisphaerae bacterium]|nr:ABC transporter ATP-binding protein [Lentisphaerota bacterium]
MSKDGDSRPKEMTPFEPRHYTVREIFARMWPLLRPYKLRLAFSSVLVGLVGFAASLVPLLPKYIFDVAIPQQSLRLALLAGGVFLGTQMTRMVLWYFAQVTIVWVRECVLSTLRENEFGHLQKLCLRFHHKYPSGFLYEQLFGRSINVVGGFFATIFNQIVTYVMGLLFSLGFCLAFSVPMTGVIIAGTVGYVTVARKLSPRIHQRARKSIDAGNQVAQYVMDKLRGTKTIQALAIEDRIQDDFETRVHDLRTKCYEVDLEVIKLGFITEGLGYLISSVIIVGGAYAIIGGDMPIGTLVAFMGYQGMLIGLVQSLTGVYGNFMSVRASFDQLFTVLDTRSTVVEKPGAVMSASIRGDIEFRDASFGYQPGQPVIRNFSAAIPAGQIVALVGRSGAGKTTMTNLLMRFYDPETGSIRVDGADIRELPLQSYRSLFGVVFQDPYLFDDTIAVNLRCARAEATDAELLDALDKAKALDFVTSFSDGLHHRVGEGGAQLSGGQRQRIAIARCMLLKARFVLLDESTSALDAETEAMIQKAFESLFENRTVVIIAHRLSTIRNADRIIVMDEGRLVEDGTFERLLEDRKLFFRLYTIATSTSTRHLKLEEAGFA